MLRFGHHLSLALLVHNILGQVSLLEILHFSSELELVDQFFPVIHYSLFSLANRPDLPCRIVFPNSDVRFFTAAQNISALDCPTYTADLLHSLCMITVLASTSFEIEDPHRLVETARHELTASRRVVQIKAELNLTT